MTLGGSWRGGLGMLQTRRSPSSVCAASMSVFCLDDDPCHARPVILDGALVVVKVCRMVNDGCNVAIKIDPLRYLCRVSCTPLLQAGERTQLRMFDSPKQAQLM